MALTTNITYFESLINRTDKKSEIKIYSLFIFILKDLIGKELSEKQYQAIENELDRLELKSPQEHKKRYFRKKLNIFKTYLQTEFSFITEGYYMAIGMTLGMSFGLVFGTALNEALGVSMGLSLGMLIGIVIGSQMDTKAKREGLVLRTKI
ncbi:MAG: hypothetical protein L3J45_01450 [Flavobacteriaceae bacterium]|nr:hypothetical protein [Flavobacteriaceae bacterium]